MSQFQVDLRGIVEILSRNLYSSPRVFVRELLQNAVDAITVRRELDAQAPGEVVVEVRADGAVTFADTGIGLTAAEVEELLATIGRSSKRDEFQFQRAGLLGQFGIGLLSCFLVSDEIEVRTRSVTKPGAPTLRWLGRGDGTYDLGPADTELAEPGTRVTLRPRPGEQWLRPAMVRELAGLYGSILPVPVTFAGPSGERVPVAPMRAAWELTEAERELFCRQTFGFTPLAVVPLRVELAGVTGLAFVLPHRASPTEPRRHQVYLRRMLLGESVHGLLPDWAYFVHAVVNVESLRPTASRESLHDDDLLAATRDELGRQLRTWLLRTAATDPDLLETFIETHDVGVKSVALHDDDMLAIVRDWVRWDTTTGRTTFRELVREGSRIDYVPTVSEYNAIENIAQMQRYTVINAGHTHEVELLERLTAQDPAVELHAITPADVAGRMFPVDPGLEPGLRAVADLGAVALDSQWCDVVVRTFEPPSTPALYVPDPHQDRRDVREQTHAGASESALFADLLGFTSATGDDPRGRALLVLNADNPVVRSLAGLDADLAADVVRGLYALALLAGRRRMTDADRGLLTTAFLALIDRAR